MSRFVIEGEWSGYSSHQRRIVHRSVHSGSAKKLRAWCEQAGSILYNDGTRLYLSVRDAKPRERVKVIHGYDSLIQDCAHYNVTSVSELPRNTR